MLKEKLKSVYFSGAFLFCGEEEYLKRYYLEQVREKLVPDPDLACFDTLQIDGAGDKELLAAQIEGAVITPPVMNEYKLIEVHSCDFEAYKKPENKAAFEALCGVLELLPDYSYATVLFYCTPDEFFTGYRWDQSAQFKALEKRMCIVPFFLQTPAKLKPWCRRHFKSEGIEAGEDVIALLLDQCGCQMQGLYSEIEKLCLWCRARGKDSLQCADVRRVCTLTPTEEDFGLSNALKRRDVGQAIVQYRLQRAAKTEPVVLFSQISGVVNDMWRVKTAADSGMTQEQIAATLHLHAFVVQTTLQAARQFSDGELKGLLSLCYDTDLALKSAPTPADVLLERLIAAFGKAVP